MAVLPIWLNAVSFAPSIVCVELEGREGVRGRERERERKKEEGEGETVTGGHRILEGDVVSPYRPFSIHMHTDTMTCMYTATPVQNKQKAKGYIPHTIPRWTAGG